MDLNNIFINSLKEINEGYYNDFVSILKAFKPIINSGTLISEVGYTPHDIDIHSANIFRILGDILPKEFYIQYNKGDNIFLLAIAVVLHDIAMSKDSRFYERNRHSETGRMIVLEEIYSNENTILKTFIPDRSMAECLGDIILAHSDTKDEDNIVIRDTLREIIDKYTEKQYNGKMEKINVPFLSAILRLSDELDLDYNRIKGTGYEKKYNIDLSKEHYEICKYFKKIRLNKYQSEIILEVDEFEFDKLDDNDKQTVSARIVNSFEKVKQEFQKMKDSIFFSTLFSINEWKIENVCLVDTVKYYELAKKKK